MRLGIFAKTFAGSDPATVLAAARKAGYDAVQYNMACSGIGALPTAIAAEVPTTVRAAAEANNVEIAAVSATYNMIHPDPEKRAAGRMAFKAIAAAASAMGTTLLTVCSGSRDAEDQWRAHPDNQGAPAWQALLDEFAKILPVAASHGVTIGVEPEHGNVVNNAATARRLLETLQSDRVKIVLDVANLVDGAPPREWQALIETAADQLHGHIAMAHAKDCTADGKVVAAGLGTVDFGHFVRVLHAVGFDGPLVTHGLAAGEAALVAQFLRATLAREGLP